MHDVLLDLLKQRLAAIEAERPLVRVEHYDVDTTGGPKPSGWRYGLGGSTSPDGRLHRLSIVYDLNGKATDWDRFRDKDPHPVHGYDWVGLGA